MKQIHILILIVFNILIVSCKQEVFEKESQNSLDYDKLVLIEDLVYLHEIDNEKQFATPLYIEVVINGITSEALHVQDDSNIGLKILTSDTEKFNVHDIIRVKTGGMSLSRNNYHYILDHPDEITQVGQGSENAVSVSLSVLIQDIDKYTSRTVRINEDEINFSLKENKHETTSYLIDQSFSQDLKLWVNIPNGLNYDMPMAISSVQGVIIYEDESVFINIRGEEDVQEVYVEPSMMEKILQNGSFVQSVVQSTEEEIAPGVKMATLSYINKESGELATSTILEADLNNPKVRVEGGSPNDQAPPPYAVLQNLTTMASGKNNYYKDTNWRVLAAITGDLHQGAAPSVVVRGPVIRYGQILSTEYWDPAHYVFGIKKDLTTPIIANRTEFEALKNDLEHAVGGVLLLKDGEIPNLVGNRDARAAIGFSPNNRVYLFVGNGRHPDAGAGYTRHEIAQVFQALGCEGGVYLMEGGASVGVIEDENNGEYKPFSRTHATNVNHNPPLASSWMIVTERD